MTPPIIRKLDELRRLTAGWRARGETVAVVPTMGALHEGHLSLVRAATSGADRVIVTIFVNPRQFNNPEDLKNYPRTEQHDAKLLAPLKVDLVYVPDPDQIYPDGFSTNVSVSGLSDGLCGAHRPGHFDGVATVVAKLFLQTQADQAYFGEKDWQQLQLVKRLAKDLDIPIRITGCPTIREAGGLALSSRNQRLSAPERAQAPALHAAMRAAAAAIRSGQSVTEALAHARSAILASGFSGIDYLELRDAENLVETTSLDRPARLFAAAFLGQVRLIDNIGLEPA